MDLGRGLKVDSMNVAPGENTQEKVGHSSSNDDILMEVEGASSSSRSSEDVAVKDAGDVVAKTAAVEVEGGVGESEVDREAEPEVVDLRPELTSSGSDTGGERERQEGVKKRKTDHILNSRNARWGARTGVCDAGFGKRSAGVKWGCGRFLFSSNRPTGPIRS